MTSSTHPSSTEDAGSLPSLWPWWAAVVMAIASYVALSQLALEALDETSELVLIGQTLAQTFGPLLRVAAHYVLPVVCLLALAALLRLRWRRRMLLATRRQRQASRAPVLEGLGWSEFQKLMSEAFQLRGFEVVDGAPGLGDEGGHLTLRRGGRQHHVACRYWKRTQIDAERVVALHQALREAGIACDFMLSAGRYSSEARAYASRHGIKLIDGMALHLMIRQARAIQAQAAAMAASR